MYYTLLNDVPYDVSRTIALVWQLQAAAQNWGNTYRERWPRRRIRLYLHIGHSNLCEINIVQSSSLISLLLDVNCYVWSSKQKPVHT